MRLSPLDIKKQEFNRGFRGFEEEEVSAFLQMLADQWDEVLEESRRLESRVAELENKLQHYQRVEDALQEALNTAKSSSKTKLANAEQEAALLLREAQSKGEQIMQEAKFANQSLIQSNISLDQRQQQILARLKAFLSSELDMLSRFDKDAASVEPLKEQPTPSFGSSNGVASVSAAPAVIAVEETLESEVSRETHDVNDDSAGHDSLIDSVSGFPNEGEEVSNVDGNDDYEAYEGPQPAELDYNETEAPDTREYDNVTSDADSDFGQSFDEETARPHEDRPPLRDNVSPADVDKIRRILDDLD